MNPVVGPLVPPILVLKETVSEKVIDSLLPPKKAPTRPPGPRPEVHTALPEVEHTAKIVRIRPPGPLEEAEQPLQNADT